MKLRDLLIAAAVLAVLLGILYWSNHRQPTKDVKVSADGPVNILSLNQVDIVGLTIHRKDLPQLDLSRNDSGVWQITAPKVLATDPETVSGLLSTVSSLKSERLIEDKASDLAAYGLDVPPLAVQYTLKDRQTRKLLVGDQTPAGNAYYAMLAGDPRVFTIASFNKNSMDKTVNDLRDKRLLTVDFDKVSQIELVSPRQDITFARIKDAWQILKPKPLRADANQIDDLVRMLREAKMDIGSDTDDAQNAARFGAASPFAIVRITGQSGTQEFEVRKAKDVYYTKSSILSSIYKVPVAVGTGLDKSLDDFLNMKLFDFGYQVPDKIEIHDGSKSYFLTHSGGNWWGPDGKKVDETTAEMLISKIRDLSAKKFLTSGFTKPFLELTVLSNDNRRVEKVLVARNGETNIARRENDPVLYEISSSTVAELQKAAADLKPTPETK
jgi:Domain of unknown function (DUF4340)